jgi:excisionase family DNA binding protein
MARTSTAPVWLSIPEAAEWLGVSPRTIRRKIADGTIRAHTLGRRIKRIRLSDLEASMHVVPSPRW